MEKITFETNVPQEVVLRFDDGVPVEGRFGDQVRYSLESGEVMYLPPFLAKQISELGIKRGMPFSLCKREVRDGNRKTVRWEVTRPEASGRVDRGSQPGSSPAAAPSGSNGSTNGAAKGNGHAASVPAPAHPPSSALGKAMMAALREAVDAVEEGESYARDLRYPLRFTSEDVRAIGLTLFIQFHRQGGVQ